MLMLLNYARPYTSRLRRQEGQTMAEYAVVLAVITLAVVGIFIFLGDQIVDALTDVGDRIDGKDDGDAPAAPAP